MSVPKVDPELFIARLDQLYKSWEVKKQLANDNWHMKVLGSMRIN